jgi:hypothetical protein
MSDSSQQRPERRWLRIAGSTITCLVILAASVAAVVVINRTESTAKKNQRHAQVSGTCKNGLRSTRQLFASHRGSRSG